MSNFTPPNLIILDLTPQKFNFQNLGPKFTFF